jgi:hypothetical protein
MRSKCHWVRIRDVGVAKIASRIVLEELRGDLDISQAHEAVSVAASGDAWIDWISMAEWAPPVVQVASAVVEWCGCFHRDDVGK